MSSEVQAVADPLIKSARTKSRRSGYEPERGTLIVVSAPSGAGKSSLVERAMKRLGRLRYSISYTTRQPRGPERHGVDYFFVDEATFMAMRERGEFIETAWVHGYYYGTHKATIEKMLAEGSDVMMDIDVQGAAQMREHMPEAVTIFIMPP